MNYTTDELASIGLAEFGCNVLIHRSVELIAPERIFLRDNVRIDCFSILSAGSNGIHVGSQVHLGASSYIFGGGGKVVFEDFSGLSSRVSIYTASDDYSEGFLTNPTVPERYKKVTRGPVTLRRHVIVGVGSVIMPGVEIGLGASVGALAFVNRSVPEFSIVAGNPAKSIGERSRALLELERKYLDEIERG